MPSPVQLGQITQQIVLEREQHRQQADQIQKEVTQLEEVLEDKRAKFHQHLGAIQAKEETLRAIQNLAQQAAGNPDNDPNAESDQ